MFNYDTSFNPQLHQLVHITLFACLMVLNATFNNISVTSLSSVLLVEKIGVPRENYRPVESHSQALSHSVVLSTRLHERGSNILLEKLHVKYLPFLFRNIHPLLVWNLQWTCTHRGENGSCTVSTSA